MRLQIATKIRSRDGTLAKDSGLVNALSEIENPDICIKRGGSDLYYNLQAYGSDPWVGQGIFTYNNDIYSVVDDVLIKNNTTTYAT